MNPEQRAFLQLIAEKIPRLFKSISEGNVRAEYILGQRCIRGRQVRLKLVAEVVDPGGNPLSTHSKPPLIASSNHKQKCVQTLRFEIQRRELLQLEKTSTEVSQSVEPDRQMVPPQGIAMTLRRGYVSLPFDLSRRDLSRRDSSRKNQPASEAGPSNQPG